jgi:hypothetical protein
MVAHADNQARRFFSFGAQAQQDREAADRLIWAIVEHIKTHPNQRELMVVIDALTNTRNFFSDEHRNAQRLFTPEIALNYMITKAKPGPNQQMLLDKKALELITINKAMAWAAYQLAGDEIEKLDYLLIAANLGVIEARKLVNQIPDSALNANAKRGSKKAHQELERRTEGRQAGLTRYSSHSRIDKARTTGGYW